MWEGSYLSRTAESVFSWGVVTEMTENLIERGEYKIKLGLQNAPVMEEQLSFFDMGGGAAVYEVPEPQRTGELFPIRTVPQAVIDQALYTAGNSYNSAYRVAVFYARQRSETECIAFLRREFGTENGRGIEYEGQKIRRVVHGGRYPSGTGRQHPHQPQPHNCDVGAGIGADTGAVGGRYISFSGGAGADAGAYSVGDG